MKPRRSVLHAVAWVLSALVVVWRVLAYARPSSLIDQAPGYAPALTGVGLAFVVAGLAAYRIRPGAVRLPFLVWCLCSGVHWGGAVGASSAAAELGLLLFYVGLSVAGEAALMHLAWAFEPEWKTPRWARVLLYAPAVASLLLAPFAGALPRETLSAFVGFELLVGMLLGLGAGVSFILRWFRADRRVRREGRLGIVVACLLVAGVPSLLASFGILPGPSDAYNLLVVVLPVGVGYALAVRLGPE